MIFALFLALAASAPSGVASYPSPTIWPQSLEPVATFEKRAPVWCRFGELSMRKSIEQHLAGRLVVEKELSVKDVQDTTLAVCKFSRL